MFRVDGWVRLAVCCALAAAGGAQAACENAAERIQVETRRGRGCEGQVLAYLTNTSDTRVVCKVGFEQANGHWSPHLTGVRAGHKLGGESGGLWTCQGTGRVKWACAYQPKPRDDFSCKLPDFR
jgi:hypothetical protein